MSSDASPNNRVIELESLIAHLQHDFDELNAVILQQQVEITKLKNALSRLEDRLGAMSSETENPDPETERPPHY